MLARLHRAVHIPVIHRIIRRIGRRGYFLLTLCAVDILVGWNFLYPDSESRALQNARMAEIIPLDSSSASQAVWAVLWWITAGFCLVNAFRREDRWGFGAAVALKVLWSATYVFSAIEYSQSTGYVGAAIWVWIATLVLAVSTWPEDRPTLRELMISTDPDSDGSPTPRADAYLLESAAHDVTAVAQRLDAAESKQAADAATDDGGPTP